MFLVYGGDKELVVKGYVDASFGTDPDDSKSQTVLAKCSAKEEFAQRRKAKQDITDYTHLSICDIVSGYLNQVHNSRDLEVDMVKQIQHKSEV